MRHTSILPQSVFLFNKFKNASAFFLRDARHAMHDIFLLRISAILPEAISDGGLTPTTDTDLLLATYRGGSHFTSDLIILILFHNIQITFYILCRFTLEYCGSCHQNVGTCIQNSVNDLVIYASIHLNINISSRFLNYFS